MKRAYLLASGLALAMAGIAVADAAPGKASATPSLLAGVKAGTPTRMIYELEAKAYVLFIPATGRASFTVDMQPENYVINSRVKVTGIADWFINYDMVLQASGYTRDNALKTYSYVSQNRDGKKNRRVNLTIGPDSFKMKAEPEFGNLGDPAATTEQVLKTNDPITALITFALEPRAPGADPCGGPIRIWSGNAIECHVTMEKVAGYKKGESNKDNLSGIDGPLRMWLAPLENGTTVPVKIQADTDKIGKITLQAKKLRFEPIVTEEAAVTPGGG